MKKFILERHAYAPELNQLIFDNGATMPAPKITSIKEARKELFSPAKNGKLALINYKNKDNPSLNRTYSGYCGNGCRFFCFMGNAVTDHETGRYFL